MEPIERNNEMTKKANPELVRIVAENDNAFADQLPKLEEILFRYQSKPESISIADDAPLQVKEARMRARENPIILIESLFASKDAINELQKPYDEALSQLASANGIKDAGGEKKENLAREIEAASLKREEPRIKAHIENGGNVAIVMLGIGGTGKGTMIEKSDFERAVNHTTRAIRPGEAEGKDYYYRTDFNMDTPKEEVEKIIGSEILADLVRPGRGRYLTSKESIMKSLKDSKVVIIEQSPEKTYEIAENAKEIMPNLLVLPVCILPPDRGVMELATRVVVRSYGDPNHQDLSGKEGVYKLKDTYLTSTIGPEQIKEITDTKKFIEGDNQLGIVYIVNDDLSRAVNSLNGIFKA